MNFVTGPAPAEYLAAHVSRCRKTSGRTTIMEDCRGLGSNTVVTVASHPLPPFHCFCQPRPEWPGRGPVASFRWCNLSVKLLDGSPSGPPHLLLRFLLHSFCDPRRMLEVMRQRHRRKALSPQRHQLYRRRHQQPPQSTSLNSPSDLPGLSPRPQRTSLEARNSSIIC